MKEIILKNNEINISKTFECGQCFRWEKQDEGSYFGVAYGRAATIKKANEKIIINSSNEHDTKEFWEEYLDLSTDYSQIKNKLKTLDPIIKKSIEYGEGIHILKQDFTEVLISFIFSANNNISRIKK